MVMERNVFLYPWTPAMFVHELTVPFSYFYVCYEQVNEKIAGYIGFWCTDKELHLMSLAVSEPYRRKGIAIWLVQYMLFKGVHLGADTVLLEVRESNKPAQNLYAKLGFLPLSYRRAYYPDGENAVYFFLFHIRLFMYLSFYENVLCY
jgi:ribosomal-protein-alanine N-acetyltransferase